MKILKYSIASIAATIACALTISVNAGIVKYPALAPVDFCYTSINSKLTCVSPIVELKGLSCAQALTYVGKPVYSISTAERIPLVDVTVMCAGNQIFCCAEIESISSAHCAGQPQLTIDGITSLYKISAIHCDYAF